MWIPTTMVHIEDFRRADFPKQLESLQRAPMKMKKALWNNARVTLAIKYPGYGTEESLVLSALRDIRKWADVHHMDVDQIAELKKMISAWRRGVEFEEPTVWFYDKITQAELARDAQV